MMNQKELREVVRLQCFETIDVRDAAGQEIRRRVYSLQASPCVLLLLVISVGLMLALLGPSEISSIVTAMSRLF